jgi:type VII secretion integral membrane protein EccD
VQVDLALPASVPVAELLPAVLDMLTVLGDTAGPADSPSAGGYRLSRPGAPPLSPSKTLTEQAIRDGELLILTPASTPPPSPHFDVVDELVTAGAPAPQSRTARMTRLTAVAVTCWMAGLIAVALLHTAFGTGGPRHVGIAAVIGAAALFGAGLMRRTYHDATAGLALGLLAIGVAAVAGFLAVPGGPGAPNVLLAAMATTVASTTAAYVTDSGAALFTSLVCVSSLGAVAGLAGTVSSHPLYAVGAVLAAVSIGLLAIAARLALAMARLAPQLSPGDEEPPPGVLHARAIRAHQRMTGLVVGFGAAGALGAVVTAAGVLLADGPRVGGAVFVTSVAAALMLRARVHTDRVRARALIAAGTLAFSSLFMVTPWSYLWAIVPVAVTLSVFASTGPCSPPLRRAVEVLEYATLAAVVPLACWVCGLYDAVRGLSLA